MISLQLIVHIITWSISTYLAASQLSTYHMHKNLITPCTSMSHTPFFHPYNIYH